MSEEKPVRKDPGEEKDYVPASPLKRAMAWVALVYVLIFLALTTYYYYTGTMLGNLAPLLTLPGLVGMGILAIVSHRSIGSPSKGVTALICLAAWGMALVTLPMAYVGLMSNFS